MQPLRFSRNISDGHQYLVIRVWNIKYQIENNPVLAILKIWEKYHKAFQIVDYTMKNLQNGSKSKIVGFVPLYDTQCARLIVGLPNEIWSSLNINLLVCQ